MLLDRKADLHLARRSGAEGWLIKPLDALRLKRAAKAIMNGGTYTEGIPVPEALTADQVEAHESTEEEPATAG